MCFRSSVAIQKINIVAVLCMTPLRPILSKQLNLTYVGDSFLDRSVFPGGAWSGYVFNETLNTWRFIDGSAGPTGSWVQGDLNSNDNGNPAHCARFHGGNLNDRGCGSSLPYVCSHPGNNSSIQNVNILSSNPHGI